MAHFNPGGGGKGGMTRGGASGVSGEDVDLPLSDTDIFALQAAVQSLLDEPSGNEQAEMDIQLAGQRLLEHQDMRSSTVQQHPLLPDASLDPVGLGYQGYTNMGASTSWASDPSMQASGSSQPPSSGSFQTHQALYGGELLHHYQEPSASSSSSSWGRSFSDYQHSSKHSYFPNEPSTSQAFASASTSRSVMEFGPENPRKTSRGGYRPTVDKIYDDLEENKLRRRKDLGNVACQRNRKNKKIALKNIQETLDELNKHNKSLLEKQQLMKRLISLFKKYLKQSNLLG